jgi:hypothetical protein
MKTYKSEDGGGQERKDLLEQGRVIGTRAHPKGSVPDANPRHHGGCDSHPITRSP